MAQNDIDAAARAIFCVIKPPNMVDSDWDSGAVLGLGNALRDQCIKAARASLAAVPASEPVAWMRCRGEDEDYKEFISSEARKGFLDAVPNSYMAQVYTIPLYAAAPAPVSGMPDLAKPRTGEQLYQSWAHQQDNRCTIPPWDKLAASTQIHWNKQAIHALPSPQAPDTPTKQG